MREHCSLSESLQTASGTENARNGGHAVVKTSSDANVETEWLGNLDSNQDRRSQSPLFYH